MRFPTLTYRLGEKPMKHCSFCGRALFPGAEVWQCSGEIACCGCFEPFAKAELAPFHTVLGEEEIP